MRRQRGFVLVNALVLVAALAAAAVFLLGRADAARVQSAAATEAAQLAAYLDGFESLAQTLLNADAADGAPGDHPGEGWATPIRDVALDRGQISGRIADMQALFNLNMLTNPEDEGARAAFDRLLETLGIAPQKGDAIVAHLSRDGPAQATAYARARVPTRPVGGALFMPQQLDDIPALEPRDLVRLRTVATVLRGQARINVNTAPAPVLAAFLPGANAAGLATLVQRIRREPLTSVDGFITELDSLLSEADLAAVNPDRFTTNSEWFELNATATLDGRSASRVAVLRRWPLPRGAEVAYRLDDWTR